ncbi:MAG: hypothetical protein DWQ42_11470 [Planctomycetota bacterium]|nr:MAG: hypothetical protein DWQ42_11470 [Planctomycetota bacterium]REK45947.1 MAG: hypothetical protein DWQ46_07960 [Planctomycetota bacterium]
MNASEATWLAYVLRLVVSVSFAARVPFSLRHRAGSSKRRALPTTADATTSRRIGRVDARRDMHVEQTDTNS